MSIRIGKERLYLHAPNANIVMCFWMEGALDADCFERALAEAARRHGVFATRAAQAEDGEAYYEPCEVQPQRVTYGKWQNDASEEESAAALTRDSLAIERGEWARHIILVDENRWLWLMGMHHMAGDGLSMLFFAQDALRSMAGEPLGAFEPLKPFDGADIPASAKLNPVFRLMARSVARRWSKRGRQFTREAFGRMRERYWHGRVQKYLRAEIFGEELDTLLAACHTHSVTVTAALTAAFVQASGESDVGYAASLRKKGCESMANLATGVSIRCAYDTSRTFWDNAQAMLVQLHEKLEDDSKKFLFFNFMSAIPGTLIDAAYYSAFDGFTSPIASQAAGMLGFSGKPKGFSLTNLTTAPIAYAYGAASIEKISFYPPMIPGTRRLLGVVTLRGRMAITMQFSDEFEKNTAIFEGAVRTLRELV